MGCAGGKEMRTDDGGASDDSDMQGGTDKTKTFRERRLSISQQADASNANRRLSVYGNPEDGPGQPSEVVPPDALRGMSCGCNTMGGVEPVPGGSTAKINQDRGLAIYPWNNDKCQGLFGVYDGHGRAGEKVSEFVLQNLPGMLLKNDHLKSAPGRALSDSYIQVDEELAAAVDASVSGTTAVTCLIENKHLWIANSGDSRAIICRRLPQGGGLKAIDLTIDHKPDSPGEMKRILQMGGHVTPAGANGSPARVWHNLRGLAMARSIGDHAAATVGVIAEPEITEYDVVDDDYCIVIASDGVWELLSSQQVADIIFKNSREGGGEGDVHEMALTITDQSSYMWKVEEGDYRDDITVVVLKLPWLPPEQPAT